MHAILALSASDLAPKDPRYTATALAHRVRAIEALKPILSPDTAVTHESANALLATCLALTIQSVAIDDGLTEYMTFMRGLVVVGTQLWKGGFRPIFANLAGGGAQAVLEPHMAGLRLLRTEWTDAAVRAIAGLEAVCGGEVERECRALLLDWARTLYVSSWEGKFSFDPLPLKPVRFLKIANSVQGPRETLHVVDLPPARALPAARRPAQPGRRAPGLALDRAAADHGVHQRGAHAVPEEGAAGRRGHRGGGDDAVAAVSEREGGCGACAV